MRSAPYSKSPQMGMYSPYGGGGLPTGFGTPKFYDDPTLEALQSRTLYFGRLPTDITDEKLHKLCEEYGDMKKCVTYPQKYMGFVEFYDIRAAEKCRCGLKGYKFGDKTIEVQYSTPKIKEKDNNTGTLYVRPQGADRSFVDPNSLDDYKALFEEQGGGDVKKVTTNRKREAEKFVEFFDSRSAMKAQEILNGYTFNGVALEVQFAQQPSRSLNKDSKAAEYRRGKAPEGYGPYRSGGHMDSNSAPIGGGGGWVPPPSATGPYNPYASYGEWGGYGNRGWSGDASCMGYGAAGMGNYGSDYLNTTGSYNNSSISGGYTGTGEGAAATGGYNGNRGSAGGYGGSSGCVGGYGSSSNGYGASPPPAGGGYGTSSCTSVGYSSTGGGATGYGNTSGNAGYGNPPANTTGYNANSGAGGYGAIHNAGYGNTTQSTGGYGSSGVSNGAYGNTGGGTTNYGVANGGAASGGYGTTGYGGSTANTTSAVIGYRGNNTTGYGASANTTGYGSNNASPYGTGGYGTVGSGTEQDNAGRDSRYNQSGGYANGPYASNAYGSTAGRGVSGAGYNTPGAYGNAAAAIPAAVSGRTATTDGTVTSWNLNYGNGMTA